MQSSSELFRSVAGVADEAMGNEFDEVWKERIAESLSGMRYGTVEITVHDGQIVQIERRERIRLELPKPSGHANPAARAGSGRKKG
ncbi:YezD family protein [Alicyclobacillus macrosporangiidus]|uniref:DUF2292 domain-containing protein n=1 Tax=Alicyclobacillus macrosporangiidus TaxID=392015 RepID=A0A1I7JQ59_9BACL|nr:hypothetical protein SAMN05421543_11147 [Alicyclobacillus macrosporangiidus]